MILQLILENFVDWRMKQQCQLYWRLTGFLIDWSTLSIQIFLQFSVRHLWNYFYNFLFFRYGLFYKAVESRTISSTLPEWNDKFVLDLQSWYLFILICFNHNYDNYYSTRLRIVAYEHKEDNSYEILEWRDIPLKTNKLRYETS